MDVLGFVDSKKLSRKLTIVIDYQLGRPSFKDGNLEILLTEQDGEQKIVRLDAKEEGHLSVHVFPSYIPFRTTGISEGMREYIICWGLGPRFV